MIVQRNKPNVTRICKFFFRPGPNQIDEELKNRLLKDRQFLYELKSGTMNIVTAAPPASAPEEKPAEVNSLGDLNSKNAIAMIQETVDLRSLEEWEAVEERSGVLKAITKQKEVIAPPPPATTETSEIPEEIAK